MTTLTTVPDCNLDGHTIPLSVIHHLSSEAIARIIGKQQPGNRLEDSNQYTWSFKEIPLEELRCSNEDGEEPSGGWKAAYLRHKKSDDLAIAQGSPEYAGREQWNKKWCENTAIYPLYVVVEEGQYRLLDGYHRLASAFWNELPTVYAFVGRSKS